MYCSNCGYELNNKEKYCPQCGKALEKNGGSGKNVWQVLRRILFVLMIVPLVILGLVMVFILIDDGEEEPSPVVTIATTEAQVQEQASYTETEPFVPEDGWYTENGESYYFSDGKMYVELHEIDGDLYYFDEDGVLAVNTDVRYEEAILEADNKGRITGITYDAIYGSWADESYRFGNGGSSSIREFSSEIENCDSFRFYLEAEGERGAKVNGKWKLYIRCNGDWEFVQDFDYKQPKGYVDIEFDTLKTFDAITAYPTVRGNASYSVNFHLQNVHCLLF